MIRQTKKGREQLEQNVGLKVKESGDEEANKEQEEEGNKVGEKNRKERKRKI